MEGYRINNFLKEKDLLQLILIALLVTISYIHAHHLIN